MKEKSVVLGFLSTTWLVHMAALLMLSSCTTSTPAPTPGQSRQNSVEVVTTEIEKGTWKVSVTCCINADSRAEALRQSSALIMAYSKEVPEAKKVPAEAPQK
jgi:hypothetical protein